MPAVAEGSVAVPVFISFAAPALSVPVVEPVAEPVVPVVPVPLAPLVVPNVSVPLMVEPLLVLPMFGSVESMPLPVVELGERSEVPRLSDEAPEEMPGPIEPEASVEELPPNDEPPEAVSEVLPIVDPDDIPVVSEVELVPLSELSRGSLLSIPEAVAPEFEDSVVADAG